MNSDQLRTRILRSIQPSAVSEDTVNKYCSRFKSLEGLGAQMFDFLYGEDKYPSEALCKGLKVAITATSFEYDMLEEPYMNPVLTIDMKWCNIGVNDLSSMISKANGTNISFDMVCRTVKFDVTMDMLLTKIIPSLTGHSYDIYRPTGSRDQYTIAFSI